MRALLTALLLIAPSAAAKSQGLSNTDETVSVGVYQNSPKIGLDEQGNPQGIFIDLIEAIAEREGWQVEYVAGSWKEGLERLAAGEIDLMPDVALTAERAALFTFHEEPALSSWHQVYAPVGSSIASILDLDGRRVAVLEGSIQQDQMNSMVKGFGIEVDMVSFPSFDAAFRAVEADQADAVVTNRFFGEYNAARYGLEDTSVIFSPSRLYFAAPPAAPPHLLETIDQYLASFKQDPQSPLYQTLDRWTRGPPLVTWPRWLPWAAAAMMAILVGGLIIVLLLRGQVRARSRQIYQQAREHTRELERRVKARTQELDQSVTLLQGLIDQVPSIIFYKNAELEFIGCNQAYERAFGVRRADILGRTVLDLDFLDPSDRERFQEEQRAVMRQGGTVQREVSIRLADDREHQLLYSATRVDLGAQSPPVMIGMLVDISDQKRVESELAIARDRAQAADRVKSVFLATMSHELRTPLNSIIGFTGILLQELAGPLNDEQTKQLKMVRNSSQHLLSLINDVLDISRIEAGEMTLDEEEFDLPTCVDKVVEIIRPLAKQKNLSLHVDHRCDPGSRMGDARRLEQILLNLLSNAVKFTESGSVDISVDKESDGKQDNILITIKDTGIGIREQDMRSLFQPFRQIDSTLSRQHEGTGLGLVICKRLAELMHGNIEVSSQWGVGTTVTLRLPLTAASTGEPA